MNNKNYSTCKTTNWMYKIVPSEEDLWLLSPRANTTDSVFIVFGNGYVSNYSASNSNAIFPTIYLKSDTTLTGTGAQTDPYVIS